MAVVENWDESLFGDMLLADLTRREKLICRKYWLERPSGHALAGRRLLVNKHIHHE